MKTAPLATVRLPIAGGFELPLTARPDLWPRFSTAAEAQALLALVRVSVCPSAVLVDETGLGENGQITLLNGQDPNAARIWTVQGVVKLADGKTCKIDDWAGDVWDRRTSPNWWEDRNPNAGYVPPGGPYLSVYFDGDAFGSSDVPTGALLWQAAPPALLTNADGSLA